MIAPAMRGPEALEAELARLLVEARGEAVVVELPAPIAAAHRLFDGPEEEAAYFEVQGELILVGLGAARAAEASGRDRFRRVRELLGPELERLSRSQILGRLGGTPVALGGFAFEDELPSPEAWRGFGAARVVVPRWLYQLRDRSASLSRVVEGFESARLVLEEHAALLDRLAGPERIQSARALPRDPEDDSRLARRIEDARQRIRDRGLEKVVLARRRRYQLQDSVSPGAVLSRLGAPEPSAVRFGFRRGTRAFVGSTPERLVAKRGAVVKTEAVAGSVVWDGVSTERSLLESRKDLDEQGFVLRFVQEALEAVSPRVVASETPRIRRLAHVGHLVTELEAEVDPALHLLDVARRLHPTPAVAGTPSDAAVRHIAEAEGFSRGWYAGAVGWFDAAGDGELRVALRCGLIDGTSAELFAGAGIVADSVPAKELREIESKLRVMKNAIGAET